MFVYILARHYLDRGIKDMVLVVVKEEALEEVDVVERREVLVVGEALEDVE